MATFARAFRALHAPRHAQCLARSVHVYCGPVKSQYARSLNNGASFIFRSLSTAPGAPQSAGGQIVSETMDLGDLAPHIIGKRARYLKLAKKQSGADLNVDADGVCHFHGTREQVKEAVQLLEDRKAYTMKQTGFQRESPRMLSKVLVYHNTKLSTVVDDDNARLVAEIEAKSGAKLNPNFLQNTVRVNGTPQQVKAARALLSLRKRGPSGIRPHTSRGDQSTVETVVVGKYVGMVIGKGGRTIKAMSE